MIVRYDRKGLKNFHINFLNKSNIVFRKQNKTI